MSRILTTSLLQVPNHPIKKLNQEYKEAYLIGVFMMLRRLCSYDKDVLYCFNLLQTDLLGDKKVNIPNEQFESSIKVCTKAIHREGFHFFTMAKIFWYDIYRILYISKRESQYRLLENLSTKFTNIFTRRHYVSAKNIFVKKTCPSQMYSDEWEFQQQKLIRVMVVGTMSAGKSTLINALVGNKILKVRATACTSALSYIYNRPSDDCVVYYDGKSYLLAEKYDSGFSDISTIAIPFKGGLTNKHIVLIDTPGVDYAADLSHRAITEKAIKDGDYDVLICVVNLPYVERIGEQELINKILTIKNKKTIFILNQADRFDPEEDSIENSYNQFKAFLKKMKSNAIAIPLSSRMALLLKQSKDNSLSKVEAMQLDEFKGIFSMDFFDLEKYYSEIASQSDDYFAKTGIKALEIELNNIQ
jgi:small GTP-binding protein